MKTTVPPHILSQVLHGRDPVLAAEAARLIGDWDLQALVPDLVKNLRTSRFYSKVSSMYSLDKLAPSESLFLEVFDNPNVPDDFYWVGFKSVKTAAAISLMKGGNPAGEGWLSGLAAVSDPVVLRWFAPALLRLPDTPAGLLTLDVLCSKDLRDAAADTQYTEPGQLCLLCEALGIINDPRASEHLEHYAKIHSRFVRGQAYRSLHMRNPKAETTQKICDWASRQGTDYDLLVAAAIAGDWPKLKRIVKEAPLGFDRASAIDALPASEEFLQVVIEALEDNDPYVRQCAVEQLGHFDDAAAWGALEGLAQRETELRVRCALAAVFASRGEATC